MPACPFTVALYAGLTDGNLVYGIGGVVLASAFLVQSLFTDDGGKKPRGSVILHPWPRTGVGGLELRRDALVSFAIISAIMLGTGIAISYLLPGR
jgi:hypothetical protein